jgi:hypothetical protein
MTGRINIGTVLIRADRAWAIDNAADALLPDHMNALIRAVEAQLGTAAMDEVHSELANTRALLGRLVRAVTDSWKPNGNHAEQVQEAVRQVNAVRAYLTGQEEEKGAA